VDGGLSAATGLLLLLVHGPWQVVPTAVWGGLLLAVLTLAALAVRDARTGPLPAPPRRTSTVGSLAGTSVVLALVLWSL
jgi:hypothetical protein